MEEGEPHAGPPGAEHSVIDPADDSKYPEGDASSSQTEYAWITFTSQLVDQQAHGRHTKCHQDEGIHNLC